MSRRICTAARRAALSAGRRAGAYVWEGGQMPAESDIPMDARKALAECLSDRRTRARADVAVALRRDLRDPGCPRATARCSGLRPFVADPNDPRRLHGLGPSACLVRGLRSANPLAGDARAAARRLAVAAAERRTDTVRARAT